MKTPVLLRQKRTARKLSRVKPAGQRPSITRVSVRPAAGQHTPGIDPELDALLTAIVAVLNRACAAKAPQKAH